MEAASSKYMNCMLANQQKVVKVNVNKTANDRRLYQVIRTEHPQATNSSVQGFRELCSTDLPWPANRCGLQSLCWRPQHGQCPSLPSQWPSSGCLASSQCTPGAGTHPGSQGSLQQCPAGMPVKSAASVEAQSSLCLPNTPVIFPQVPLLC